MTWILMEIPCQVTSQIDDSLVRVDVKFHDYCMSFIQLYLFSMLEHDMDFRKIQVMEFPWHLLRKWWDFQWIWCHFQPNCRQNHIRKSLLHFLQGEGKNMRTFFWDTLYTLIIACIIWYNLYPLHVTIFEIGIRGFDFYLISELSRFKQTSSSGK